MKKLATVCYLIDKENQKILLGRKKYGKAKRVLNGFGGKVEKVDESISSAVIREVEEETGLIIINPELVGLLLFKRPSHTVYAYVYKTHKWESDIQEGHEMIIEWHDINDIPVDEMWPEDKRWFEFIFEESGFVVTFRYPENSNNTKKVDIPLNQEIHEESHVEYS